VSACFRAVVERFFARVKAAATKRLADGVKDGLVPARRRG